MSLLSVRDLTVGIGATPVLRQVALNIAPGEVLALTGESGSGKSMTALAIMGLLPRRAVARGQITLDGVPLIGRSEAEMCRIRGRDIGMIFQEPMTALNPVQSIGDQVAETVLIHERISPSAVRARAADMLTRVGLPPDRFPLSLYPHELSGGQRQRVGIAMAMVLRPKLLIADEPTTALDVTTQSQILTLLKGLVAEFGMGMLLITHDLAVVGEMADRIAVMQQGEVVETGQTEVLMRAQAHPYTRMLFAAARHRVVLPAVPQGDDLLRVEGVVRDYRRRAGLLGRAQVMRAVDGVSFTLKRGERLGLVGESGCGKSTLTRAILGLEVLQAGRVTLNGIEVKDAGRAGPEVRRHMQVVFQDPYGSFNPRHRVSRLVSEPLHLLPDAPRGPARAAAVAEVLTSVGLRPEDASKYIHEFSGGQRQRIAIARALIIRPALIIFDEAVSALDVSVRAQVLDLLAELCGKYSLSYIFISHDLHVVRKVTDRVMVMRAGRIVEEGPTEAVFTTPRDSYTRTLIAAAPVLPEDIA